MLWKRMKIIAIIMLIGMLLTTNVVMACPEGQVPCGENSCCRSVLSCMMPFTTENEVVKCHVDVERIVIVCSVSGFSNITGEFQLIPSLQQMSEVFTEPCFYMQKCAEKFQCTRDGCPSAYYRCTTEACCPE